MTMVRTMRTALVVLLLALTACSNQPDVPVSSARPVTQAPTPSGSAQPQPDLDAAVAAAVTWTDAVRRHDAGAIYDMAWSGLRQGTSRKAFVGDLDLDTVTNARLSGTVVVGWSKDGQRAAIAPVIVTSDEIPQIGRVILVREKGKWRFFNQVEPGQEPELSQDRPEGP